MTIVSKTDSQKDDHLSLPLEIDDGRWNKVFSHMLVVLSLLCITLLILAFFAPIREIVVARGQITPVGDLIEVQHLEGGIVSKIESREGDYVKEGDLLITMDAADVNTQHQQSVAKRNWLLLERVRLVALLKDQKPDFGSVLQNEIDFQNQMANFDAAVKANNAEVQTAELKIAQRNSELVVLKADQHKYTSDEEIYRRRLEKMELLFSKGFLTRQKLDDVKLKYQESHWNRIRTLSELEVARKKLSESESALEKLIANQRKEWFDELNSVEEEISLLDEAIKNYSKKITRQLVHAPADGIVHAMAVKNSGQVIDQGEIVAMIVPESSKVEAHIRLAPEHIGHVNKGMSAKVILTTYDSETYGSAKGEISLLSPTTSLDQNGEPYYSAVIQLDSHYLEIGDTQVPILPGMVADAEIQAGSKSLMRYLLKPVYRSVGRAFSER
ncbi:MAG: HlyD family type I secretion periplasmic adaptor subunit [Pseudomonadota bacterium]